jgi:uncharacterized protein YbaA (DUF1428 family)
MKIINKTNSSKLEFFGSKTILLSIYARGKKTGIKKMKQILYISFLLYTILSCGQQIYKVNGVVKDSFGTLPGANVIIDGTNKGTLTDFNGKYSIDVKPNEFLVFSYVGMKSQRIKAEINNINVQLQEIEPLKEEYGPAYYPTPKRHDLAITIVSKKDIVHADNPKYNFNKNAKKNVFVIFVSELTTYDFSKEDLEFQENYNIKYSIIGNLKNAYLVRYNRFTFKYLRKKYKKKWHTKIRKDAVGLEKALK